MDERFVVLCIPDHFEKDKRSDHSVKLVWDNVISYTVTDEIYRQELWASERKIAAV